MNKGDAAVALNCNVTIQSVDKHGKITREIKRHNKATINMVDGLIRFLQGHFNPTDRSESIDGRYSTDVIETLSREGSAYIPTCISFGDSGITVDEDGGVNPDFDKGEKERKRVSYFREDVGAPEFYDRKLRADLTTQDLPRIYASRIRATSFENTNNSEALRISAFISPGYYVSREKLVTVDESGETLPEGEFRTVTEYSPHAFKKNGEYQVLLTELGLFSGLSANDYLLARVVFDSPLNDDTSSKLYLDPEKGNENDENLPIVQTESSTIVVDWRIGIVSVGDDDTFITEADLETASKASAANIDEEVVV